MWPFHRNKTFLDPDDEDWHLAAWGWFLARFGEDRLRKAPLVAPTPKFFPPSRAAGHALAEHVFGCVRIHAGMAAWPCELVALPERPNTRVSEFGVVKITSGNMPLGTFEREGNTVVITYDPAMTGKPEALVSTLAHELAHYLLHAVHDLPPGGEEMEEFATDLATVYLGFGVFSANTAFNFSQFGDAYSQGWRTSGQGYLRERDWSFALAVFCALRGEDVATLKPWLKPYLFSDVRKAARYLSRSPQRLAKIAEHRAAF